MKPVHERLAALQEAQRRALERREPCEHKTGDGVFVRFFSNGKRHVYRGCSTCRQPLEGGEFLPQASLNIDELPVGRDDRALAPPCVRCGALGVELHHWAPKEVFGPTEADLWPTSWLCPDCHAWWHDQITTHYSNPERPF